MPRLNSENILFQLVIGERIRMRALPKELLLRQLDISSRARLLLLDLATVFLALCAPRVGFHGEGVEVRRGKRRKSVDDLCGLSPPPIGSARASRLHLHLRLQLPSDAVYIVLFACYSFLELKSVA